MEKYWQITYDKDWQAEHISKNLSTFNSKETKCERKKNLDKRFELIFTKEDVQITNKHGMTYITIST